MSVRVYRNHDWYADCDEHDVSTCCTDWELALEAAYGHAAMAHPRLLPAFEVRVSDGRHTLECWGIATEDSK